MNNVDRVGQINWDKVRRVPRAKAKEALLLRHGDILFNATNSPDLVGKTALFSGFAEPVTFSNHFFRMRTKASVANPAYLTRWLQHQFEQGRFTTMCKSWVNQASVSKDQLLALSVPLPPIFEQRRIAAILDKADALCRKRKRAIELLDSLTQSIFLEMFGESGGTTETQTRTLASVASIGSGSTPSRENSGNYGGDTPWVKTTEVRGEPIHRSEESVSALGIAAARLKVYPVDTVLIAMYGQGVTRGRAAILKVPSTVNQACAAIIPGPQVNPTFLFHQLRLSYDRLRALGQGGNQPNLNGQMLKNFEILVPLVEEQQLFASIAQHSEAQRDLALKGLARLDNLFTSLQQHAFSGQL